MIRLASTVALLSLLAASAMAAGPADEVARLETVDIIVEAAGDGLAAYQIEITNAGDGQILSIEGGDHTAFNAPPFYDPAGLKRGRIILAAFSLSAELPTGRIRVATLHVRETGPVTYHAHLLAAARADGTRFTPPVAIVGGQQR